MMSRPLASVKTSKYSHLLLAVYCGKKKRSESGTQVSISTTLKLRFSPLSIHKPVNLNEKAEPREGEITQNSGETRPAKASIDLVTGGQLEVYHYKLNFFVYPNSDNISYLRFNMFSCCRSMCWRALKRLNSNRHWKH